jgi:hypothetical protein
MPLGSFTNASSRATPDQRGDARPVRGRTNDGDDVPFEPLVNGREVVGVAA